MSAIVQPNPNTWNNDDTGTARTGATTNAPGRRAPSRKLTSNNRSSSRVGRKSNNGHFRPNAKLKSKASNKTKASSKQASSSSKITIPSNMNSTSSSKLNLNLASPKRSWRSTGWTPLSYPSNALYQPVSVQGQNHDRDATMDSDSMSMMMDNDANHHSLELNPYFPLHKDVILATARELLILDGALDGSTLEVNIHVEKKKKNGDDVNDDTHTRKNATMDDKEEEEGAGAGAIATDDEEKTNTAKNTNQNMETEMMIENESSIKVKKTKGKKTNANANTITNTVVKLGKRKHTAVHTDATAATDTKARRSRTSMTLAALRNECPSRVIPPTAEALTEILLQNFVLRDDDHNGNDHGDDNHDMQAPTAVENDGENGDVPAATAAHDEEHQNRVRKVSDADAMMNRPPSPYGLVTKDLQTRTTSPHLAVVAINLNDNQGQSEDMETCIKQFVKHYQQNHTSVSASVSTSENDEEAMLLRLKNDGSLPKLLDLSIIMEVHLRQVALAMTKHSFMKYIGEKALREFLGYKSPTQKKDRVVELISDFMFDVSHAMFAWEQTENDMYGSDTDKKTSDGNRDVSICKVLFDRRALRKIGGFEPTSLLYHALSIQRLRKKGEAWTTLATTISGRQMFAHHRDNHVKVHVGQMRRDKRMKKNLTTGASTYNSYSYGYGYGHHHSMVVEDGEKGARTRSCSISSDGTGSTSGETYAVADSITRIPTVSPVVPNLFPVTITEESGKSWGILLAMEGSMCVVMRVPDVSKPSNASATEELQRGDLIVSIRNERNECVNTPTYASTHHDSWDANISPEWFKKAVGIFKESNTLHLEVRRAISMA